MLSKGLFFPYVVSLCFVCRYLCFRLFTVKATAKQPALYIDKDFTVYMAMDMSGAHKNCASLTVEPGELLGFNLGEIQRAGPVSKCL